MNFTLNILGTASALPIVNRHPSAQVLDVRGRLFLIDCGEGTQVMMRRMRLSFMKLSAIFISHLHGDHFFGLFGLVTTMGMLGRTETLHIFAPAQLSGIMSFFLKSQGDGLKYQIIVHELTMSSPQKIFETKNVVVTAFPLNHRIETFGFQFTEPVPGPNVKKEAIGQFGLSLAEIALLKQGNDVVRTNEVLKASDLTYIPYQPRSYAYCSDTAPFPELASWVRGVDLLYHESTYPSEMADKAAQRYHSTSAQAAECALQAGAGRLLLGHYSSKYPDLNIFLQEARAIFPATELADDGMVVDMPLKKYYL